MRINIEESFKQTTHYLLDDGRVWSIADAKFVSSVPEGSQGISCAGASGKADVAALLECLDFYNYPKGELKTDEEYAAEAREKRNSLIAETDYLVMPDYPLGDGKKAAVLAYRQALRDVPAQSGFPRQVNWPLKAF